MTFTRSSRTHLLLVYAAVSTMGCGENPEFTPFPISSISPADTILIIDIDSLAEIISVGEFQLDQQRVLILDNMARRVFCIDLSSGSRSSFGISGEAPGGLLAPVAFVSCGGIVRVVDASNGMVTFDSSGSYLEDRSGYESNMPLDLRPAVGSDFLGLRSENSFDENNTLIADVSVVLFSDSPEAVSEYCRYSIPLDLEDIGTSTYQAINYVKYAADESSGDVFVSLNSTDRINITGYRSSGEEFAVFNEECERVERLAEEIESEMVGLENHPLLGRFASMIDIDEYKPQVSSIGVDSIGQVWLETASTGCPSFLVLTHSLEDTSMLVHAPALSRASSDYDIRINSSGIIVRESQSDGATILYRMAFEPE